MRLSYHGRDAALPADGGPLIYAFWHAQLALMPWVQLRPPSVVPVSRSRDGEWTARLFERLEADTVRGSTSRGGATALRGLVRAARAGKDLAITPDGPKGPAGRVQPGAVWLARLTGRPLLPVAFAARPCLHVGSWDRMIVPLPLSRGAFEYGEHLWVPRDANEEVTEEARRELETRIAATTERARERLC
jgi:lysophospholipid acyltransferase (LPLAT)-like uncharacterized protein